MPDPKLATDANGIVTTGRFTGRHINEGMDYLEGMETGVSSAAPPPNTPPADQPPAVAPRAPGAPDPAAAALAASNATRIDPLMQSVLARQEMDDEAEFRSQVT